MYQIINSKTNHDWPCIKVKFNKPIELYVDSLIGYENNNNFKILWVKEVNEISNFKSTVLNNYSKFDLILTYDEDILKNCINSEMFEFGTTWVFDYDHSQNKLYQVSHLVGNKSITYGHKLRKQVYDNQHKILTPKDFFVSSHNPIDNYFHSKVLQNKKNELFDSQFHICIENSKQKNLFTEKLIDCLHTKTIPIFYGCDNIGDFFDTKGFYIVNDLNDIIDVCNSLNENSYNDRIEYINKNFELCLQYINLLERLQTVIQKKLNYG